ncbi:CoA-binding protein [Aliikangiella marina]|nr:CoA-binding protein [Aliikangiella marina]
MATTVVLGASQNTARFSNRAISKLIALNHPVIPVSPKGGNIHGVTCVTSLEAVETHPDTVTIYVNPTLIEQEVDKIIALAPRRVIFNPGTESVMAIDKVKSAGIAVITDCTLVMLDSGRY